MSLDGSTAFGFQRVLQERQLSSHDDGVKDAITTDEQLPPRLPQSPQPQSPQQPPPATPAAPRPRGWLGKFDAGSASQQERLQKIAYRNLRMNESIVQQLHRWRKCATSAEAGKPGISKGDYIRISRLIFRAAVQPFDDNRAQEAANSDWRDDAGGAEVMPEGRFMDCVFEVRFLCL